MKKRILFITLLCSIFIFVSCGITSKKEPTDIEKEPTLIEIQNEITEVYKQAEKGCVGIYAGRTDETSASTGSGVIYKEKNGQYYVVTNAHVITGMNLVRVYLGGTKYYRGTVVGADTKNDIAVVTFSLDLMGGPELYIHNIFDYEDELVSCGQTVLAIGCPLGLDHYNSLTTGIVSRTDEIYIQTNTDINPGNSGGGLFNLSGRLIGINTKKETYTTSYDSMGNLINIPVEGIGYAINLDTVKKCITDIETIKGDIERPLLGITVSAFNRFLNENSEYLQYLPSEVEEALIVRAVDPLGTSYTKIEENDVIISADNQRVTSLNELSALMNLKLKGDTLDLEIYRNKHLIQITITL